MKNIFQDLKRKDHKRYLGGLDLFKYIGPGLLVTVGFIDPGNWASNFAAGSEFGYSLLWVVTLSTIMLIVLQHNVAHLGIVTGLCLSEAATKYTPKWVSRPILGTAVLASISTSLAEILGGAIALEMLLDIPIIWGAVLTTLFVSIMLFTNSYKKIERSIIAFVSVIGLSFIYELFLVDIDWPAATVGWVTPAFPKGSMLIIMSVLGAVVMPHNLFLHSEVIQSHEYNKKDDASIKKVLKYELFDTLFSMIVGWAINSAMILLPPSLKAAFRWRNCNRLSHCWNRCWEVMRQSCLHWLCLWRAFRPLSQAEWRQVLSLPVFSASLIISRTVTRR